MRDLIKTINILRERIEAYKADLSKNETMTRYALIDPLLRELDWDLSDPGGVVPEDVAGTGRKTDYTMGGKAMIVEAKKLGENLDKHTDKMISYVQERDVRYGVLTNGQKWRMYDSKATTKSPEVEFDITDSEGVVISKAIHLHRSVVLDSVPQQSQVGHTRKRPDVKTRDPAKQKHEMPLPDIKYTKGMTHPTELVCPDGSRNLGSWVGIIAGVAGLLVANKHLDKSHCPVQIGPENAILNTKPVHQNGKRFSAQRKVGRLYVNMNASPPTAIRYAINLIKEAGLQPSDFKVHFEDPDYPSHQPASTPQFMQMDKNWGGAKV